MLSLPWISVVIPIKDERDNIPLLASQLLKFFEVRPESEAASFELVFVDDGSTDDTFDQLSLCQTTTPPFPSRGQPGLRQRQIEV